MDFLGEERTEQRTETNSARYPRHRRCLSANRRRTFQRAADAGRALPPYVLAALPTHLLRLHRQAKPLRTPSMVFTIAGLANRRSWSMLRRNLYRPARREPVPRPCSASVSSKTGTRGHAGCGGAVRDQHQQSVTRESAQGCGPPHAQRRQRLGRHGALQRRGAQQGAPGLGAVMQVDRKAGFDRWTSLGRELGQGSE